MVKIKRIYEKYSKDDGYRVLVDRLWPRGVSKEKAHLDLWLKEVAPSTDLRKWFGHDISRWEEFKKRYSKELETNPGIKDLTQLIDKEKVLTFLYGARDTEHNEAVVLKDWLNKKGIN
jgi:DNA-3-methyladenine glycosylase